MKEHISFKLTTHLLVNMYNNTSDITSNPTFIWFRPMQLCFIQYLNALVEVDYHHIINTIFKKKVNVVLMAWWLSTFIATCSYWIKHRYVGLNHLSVCFEDINTMEWIRSNSIEYWYLNCFILYCITEYSVWWHPLASSAPSCQQPPWGWLLLLAKTRHRRRHTHVNQQMCSSK